MTRKELQKQVQNILSGRANAADDARVLVMHTCSINHAELVKNPDVSVSRVRVQKALRLARRRLQNEPLAYLLGSRDFMGRAFIVNKHTLIPRPETELMVETALELANKNAQVIEIGTGSGAVAISFALESKLPVIATDVSKEALRVARKNTKLQRVEDLVDLRTGSLLDPLSSEDIQKDRTTIILANLPYLSESMLLESPAEVKDYEPQSALVSDDQDGLELYRILLESIKARREDFGTGIIVLLEIDPRQEAAARDLAPKVEIKNDLAGRPRLAIIEL